MSRDLVRWARMDRMSGEVRLVDILDAAQAAERLGVTRQHVVHLLKTGKLPGRRLTATWVTTRQAVEAYVQERRAPGRPPSSPRFNQ